MKPMLAYSIEFSDLHRYVNDSNWVAQLKCDGQRMLVKVDNGTVTILGRNGRPKVTGLSHTLLAQFEKFNAGQWTFDGELIGSDLVLFDLIDAGAMCNLSTPFIERWSTLNVLYNDVWKPDPNVVTLLPVAYTADAKMILAKQAEAEQREGIILRHRQGLYRPGVRSTHLLKCKFVHTVDAIISRVGIDGKDNVELTVLDPDNDRVVVIGQASAIGKIPKPEQFQVWEVKFLYICDRENPRLVQPRLMSLRTDKDMSECLFDQLDVAWTDKNIVNRVRAEM